MAYREGKCFEAVRLNDGRTLASGNAPALPAHVFEAALAAHLAEDCAVCIRVEGETILRINGRLCHDCCDRESDPDLQPVDLRVNPRGWRR